MFVVIVCIVLCCIVLCVMKKKKKKPIGIENQAGVDWRRHTNERRARKRVGGAQERAGRQGKGSR